MDGFWIVTKMSSQDAMNFYFRFDLFYTFHYRHKTGTKTIAVSHDMQNYNLRVDLREHIIKYPKEIKTIKLKLYVCMFVCLPDSAPPQVKRTTGLIILP